MQTLCCEIKGLKKYEIEIWEGGYCSALAEIKVMGDEAFFEYSGLCNIRHFIEVDRKAGVNEALFKTLAALRKITEGFELAEDYLIDQGDISLKAEDLWFNEKGEVKLLPGKATDERYIDRIYGLLLELKQGDLAAKIKEKDNQAALGFKELLRFLSSFELEFR